MADLYFTTITPAITLNGTIRIYRAIDTATAPILIGNLGAGFVDTRASIIWSAALHRFFVGCATGAGHTRIYRSEEVLAPPNNVLTWDLVYSHDGGDYTASIHDGIYFDGKVVFYVLNNYAPTFDYAPLLLYSSDGTTWTLSPTFGTYEDAMQMNSFLAQVYDGKLGAVAKKAVGTLAVYETSDLVTFTQYGGDMTFAATQEQPGIAVAPINNSQFTNRYWVSNAYPSVAACRQWRDNSAFFVDESLVRSFPGSDSTPISFEGTPNDTAFFNTVYFGAAPDAGWTSAGDSLWGWNGVTWIEVWPGFYNPGGINPTGSQVVFDKLVWWKGAQRLLIAKWKDSGDANADTTGLQAICEYDGTAPSVSDCPSIWGGQFTGALRDGIEAAIYPTTRPPRRFELPQREVQLARKYVDPPTGRNR